MHLPNPGLVASTGSSSSGFQETTREAAYPFIGTDLQYSETCSIHRLLGALLGRCRSDPPNHLVPPVSNPSTPNIPQPNENGSLDDPLSGSDKAEKAETDPSLATLQDLSGSKLGENDLLGICLQSILPLCNEDKFRKLIHEYCEAPTPEERYPPFTTACNHALQWLRALDIPQLRSASSCEILFHVNHPRHIPGYDKSHRVPDIAIVCSRTLKRVHGPSLRSWVEFSEDLCQVRPPQMFEWSEVLAFAEFKRFGPITSQLPNKFDSLLQDLAPPIILPNSQDHLDTANPASATSNAPSSASTTNACNPAFDGSQSVASKNDILASDTSLPTQTEDVPRSVSGSTRGEKRPHGDIDLDNLLKQIPLKRSKRDDQDTQEGIAQCASYAAEMLSGSAARQHAIGLFVIDHVVWVWWYDRQGAIRSSGINILQHLPLFVVLLLTLQRFSRADWGYNLELDPELQASRGAGAYSESQDIQEATTLRVVKFPGVEVSINLNDVRSRSFGLVGRGTLVLGASGDSPSVSDRELVAKLSWPDKTRLPEETIIEQAIKRAPTAEDHLPKVFASCNGYDTEVIRRQLGINGNSKRLSRVFRMTIPERLYAITSVSGLDRITAYVQCVKCHYLAWQAGVQHRDLSLANLMLRKRGDDHLGVLIDWDLSYFDGLSAGLGERGATIPFLAMELLRLEYWGGELAVEYRHELESFMWIIYWLARCSESPDGKLPKDLLEWQTSALACHKEKAYFIHSFRLSKQSTATIESRVAVPLVRDFILSHYRRELMIMGGTWSEADEPSDKSHLENFLRLVSQALLPENFELPHSPVID